MTEHTPVRKSALAEAAPALSSINKVNVGHEKNRDEPLRDDDRDGRANKTHVKVPYKEPVHDSVEWSRDQEHISGSLEETLGLDEAFSTLKDDERRYSKQVHLEIKTCQLGRAVLWDHQGQDLGSIQPEGDEWDEQQEEEAGHALNL